MKKIIVTSLKIIENYLERFRVPSLILLIMLMVLIILVSSKVVSFRAVFEFTESIHIERIILRTPLGSFEVMEAIHITNEICKLVLPYFLLALSLMVLLMLLLTILKIRKIKAKDGYYYKYDDFIGFAGTLSKISLSIIIVAIHGFLYTYFFDIIIISFKNWLIIELSILFVMSQTLMGSIYFFNCYYAKYITKKILDLYKEPDGKYIIVSDSVWQFWLPIFWRVSNKIIGWGIKAEKKGDYIELKGIDYPGRLDFPWGFYFEFSDEVSFNENGFGSIEILGRNANELLYNVIFTRDYDSGRWLFKAEPRSNVEVWEKNREKLGVLYSWPIKNASPHNVSKYFHRFEGYSAYYSATELSRYHLMNIYFKPQWYEILYNILTQSEENEIIQQPKTIFADNIHKKDEENGVIRDYYYYDDVKDDEVYYFQDGEVYYVKYDEEDIDRIKIDMLADEQTATRQATILNAKNEFKNSCISKITNPADGSYYYHFGRAFTIENVVRISNEPASLRDYYPYDRILIKGLFTFDDFTFYHLYATDTGAHYFECISTGGNGYKLILLTEEEYIRKLNEMTYKKMKPTIGAEEFWYQ
jgi:hypothetical protein